MLEELRDCNEHVLRRFDRKLPNGAMGHFTSFRIFDPAMMIDCTPVSDDTNVYLSEVLVGVTSVRVTRHKESGNESYLISLSGGNQEAKDGILSRFQEQLHIPVAYYQDVSILGSKTYEWVVKSV